MKRVYRVSEGVEDQQFWLVCDGALNLNTDLAKILDMEVKDLRINSVKDATSDLLDPTQPVRTIQSLKDILNGEEDCIIAKQDIEGSSGQRKQHRWVVIEYTDEARFIEEPSEGDESD